MHGSENQVTGFCSGQGQANCFNIAHFADQDYIRVFTQSGTQGLVESMGITMNLTLIDKALFRLVYKFNWVFNGQDMPGLGGIEVINHGSQSR